MCQGRGCKGGRGEAQEGLKGPQEEVGRGWLGDGGMESGSGPRKIGTEGKREGGIVYCVGGKGMLWY